MTKRLAGKDLPMTAVAHPGSGAALADAPDLHRFFHPRSVAVIGATDKQGSPGTINWRLIHRWAQRAGAEIYPVNPNRPTVDGVRAYPSLADVPSALPPRESSSCLSSQPALSAPASDPYRLSVT